MKRLFYSIVFLLLLVACEKDAIVQLEKEPGSVAGRVYPVGADATAGLYLSVVSLVTEVQPNSDGTFHLENVQPGNYWLRISATGYGSIELKDVQVVDGEVTDVGELLLSTLPWPL